MGLSFRLAAMKGLRKKKVTYSKADDKFERPEKKRRIMIKPDSKPCGFENITEDLLLEILVKLRAKHVITRALRVSQLWYSVISSSYFTYRFLESPSSWKRPRLLMSLVDKEDQKNRVAFLTSTSLNDRSDTSLFDEILEMPGLGGYFVNALRGLLCVRLGKSVRICNLTTKQRVTLPIIRSTLLAEANDNIWSYFGYDPVYDEYKVLNTVWEVSKEDGMLRSEHKMLVLGLGAYWRNTYSTLPPPHRPYSQGISINGVLYYGAWIEKNECVVMSFNLTSEEFSLIELPAGIVWHTHRANLINYRSKLAVLEYSRVAVDASVDLWIMEDAAGKRNWSNKTLVLPLSQMNFVHGDNLTIQSMSRCSEIRLGKTNRVIGQPIPSVIYDLEMNKITRRLEIFPFTRFFIWGLSKGLQTTFWEDDTESIMYLEI